MPYLGFDLDAKKHVPVVAKAMKVSAPSVAWALINLWEHVWLTKDDVVGIKVLDGCFGPKAMDVPEILCEFGFLEAIGAAKWRVKGAKSRLFGNIENGRKGGLAAAASGKSKKNLIPGGIWKGKQSRPRTDLEANLEAPRSQPRSHLEAPSEARFEEPRSHLEANLEATSKPTQHPTPNLKVKINTTVGLESDVGSVSANLQPIPQKETPPNPALLPQEQPKPPPTAPRTPTTPLNAQEPSQEFALIPMEPPKTSPETRLLDYWREKTGRTVKTKYSKERRAAANRALKNHPIEDLFSAVDGCMVTPHNLGQNDRGEVYTDITLILRNSGQIERFMANAKTPPKPVSLYPKKIGKASEADKDWSVTPPTVMTEHGEQWAF